MNLDKLAEETALQIAADVEQNREAIHDLGKFIQDYAPRFIRDAINTAVVEHHHEADTINNEFYKDMGRMWEETLGLHLQRAQEWRERAERAETKLAAMKPASV